MKKRILQTLSLVGISGSLLLGTVSNHVFASSVNEPMQSEEEVEVTVVTDVVFTEKQANEYMDAFEKDIKESMEQLTNELLQTNNEAKEDYLEDLIDNMSKVDATDLFVDKDENDYVIEIPMKATEITEISSEDYTTDEDGTVAIKEEDVEDLEQWCEDLDYDMEKTKDTYTITSTITAKEFAEGGLEMSNNMADAEAQACITDPVKRKKDEHSWGNGYSTSRCVYSTKAYPNIVHCNKCDDSAYENETKNYKWLADGSDCAKSIRLGTFALTGPTWATIYYANNIYCVIESCQSLSNGREGRNIYCNGDKKSGPHWNCSWFNGIQHTESFHYRGTGPSHGGGHF